jgi:heat shock protein HtpX
MALRAVGLATHIMNNHIKSVLLLLGFPLLLLIMMGSFFVALDLTFQKNAPARNIARGYQIVGESGTDRVSKTLERSNGGGNIRWGHALESGKRGMLRYGHFAVGGAAIWFLIAWFMHGRMIQMATGAKPVTREQMPKIYNMLENMCISRGLPMPKFEVIDSPALNAFASGLNEKTYRIVLTRGIIEALQDDELEAVIAHELTHIMNRDVRLLIISVIFVGMISFFAEMAFRMMIHGSRPNFYSRRSKNDGNGALIILLVAVVILAIGYLFALLIRFALSRKREYLADAGAVELTKNPEAMMRALMRIAGRDKVAGMPDEVQQMCIENSHNFMGVFATHPAIDDRIKAISTMTGTPVPDITVSLRRPPSRPWDGGVAPAARPAEGLNRPGVLFPDRASSGSDTGPWKTGN